MDAPGPHQSIGLFGVAFLNNRGLTIPLPDAPGNFRWAALAILVSWLGYWLASECRGRGLMPLVIRAFARHAFEGFALSELSAFPFHWNQASCRALEKAGFTRVGLLPARFRKGDETIDAWDYRLRACDHDPTRQLT